MVYRRKSKKDKKREKSRQKIKNNIRIKDNNDKTERRK